MFFFIFWFQIKQCHKTSQDHDGFDAKNVFLRAIFYSKIDWHSPEILKKSGLIGLSVAISNIFYSNANRSHRIKKIFCE